MQLQKDGDSMKLLVSLNKKELENYLKFTNSFIIGLKDYSVNYYDLSLEEIKQLLSKYPNIELFVAINKNIFNDDLLDLEEKLKKLSQLSIQGIMFYDLSVLEIVQRLKLNLNLGIHANHLITNYNICNYYLEHDCKYAFLSSEITESEIEEISEKTNINLIAYFIGHPIISHSKRKLVSNYYEYIKKKKTKDLNVIKEKGQNDKYYIKEDKIGTNILTYEILNGTKAFTMLKDKINYAVLDNNLVEDTLFLKILELYHDNLEKKIEDEKLISEVSNLIGDNDGFFFRKTIYKVK